MNNMQIVVTSAFIRNTKGKFLIVKRADHDSFPRLWELPGGKSDHGEDQKNAVVREVKEETGLTILPTYLLTVQSFIRGKQTEKHIVKLYFIGEIQEEEKVTLSNEHSDFAWIDFTDLEKYDITPQVKEILSEIQIHPLLRTV